MSVQFGSCNLDGRPVDGADLERVRPALVPYGPDEEGFLCRDNLGILYRAFHTTRESRDETQPHVSPCGVVIVWDGRLDNRDELIRHADGRLSAGSTDLAIVAAAYQRWGTDAFARLIGDWALSVWDPRARSLILATDFVGARHLYYSVDKNQLKWSTILEPLLQFGDRPFVLCEEYIAGWFSSFPAAHLTPYAGIRSVPPSSFVMVRREGHVVKRYWDFDSGKTTRYGTDSEYGEHFRAAFTEAVRRRLRSDRAILAELSGGMDSSAIVCMADTILARGEAETPRLDTISYYDDSEPNWDERPYFTIVEARRGRTGCHICIPSLECCNLQFANDRFAATPGSPRHNAVTNEFAACLISRGSRVVLSGIGGDEVTGGVPTPLPELADLLVRGRMRKLARQLKAWALYARRPWFHLLVEVCRGFLPPTLVGIRRQMRPAAWLRPSFTERYLAALTGYESRLKVFGALPSFQENLRSLRGLQRQLACSVLDSEPLYETRYPFLDRSLLEFLYSIPADQLVRPGQRRSLMRRALIGIVPDELLNRRRKALASRAPMASIAADWARFEPMGQHMISASLGIVDAGVFSAVLRNICRGRQAPVVTVMRTLEI